ncbi:HEAT repeat domain-containing protein [Micromonospora sp. NPDC004551]|uniref:HEAT repeat domain-containing protein n=1 Tax=Micromonospora sp. NPDC004551 TaxID=3154284 RepID=UPI0033BBE9D5
MINLDLTPADVVNALERETPDRRAVVDELRRQAPVRVLAAALKASERPLTRQLLCDLIGFRAARSALPELLEALDDHHRGVRASAADAIAKALAYGGAQPPSSSLTRRVLPTLLAHWEKESTPQVRSILATALASVGDTSVQPLLQAALGDPHEQVRLAAEWSLGRLGEASSKASLLNKRG